MLKETETEETIVFFETFLSLVAFRLGEPGYAYATGYPGYAYATTTLSQISFFKAERKVIYKKIIFDDNLDFANFSSASAFVAIVNIRKVSFQSKVGKCFSNEFLVF